MGQTAHCYGNNVLVDIATEPLSFQQKVLLQLAVEINLSQFIYPLSLCSMTHLSCYSHYYCPSVSGGLNSDRPPSDQTKVVFCLLLFEDRCRTPNTENSIEWWIWVLLVFYGTLWFCVWCFWIASVCMTIHVTDTVWYTLLVYDSVSASLTLRITFKTCSSQLIL